MNFCGNCGAPATGTPYCTNCGQPLTEQPAKQRSAKVTAGDGPGPAWRTAGAVPSQAARANPFAAITIGDYLRDALALVLLLMSLGMAWDFQDDATGKIYVILAALLSIISLSLPYLRAVSVLPPTLTAAQFQLVRLLANAPYFVVVLVTLGLGYLGENSEGGIDIGEGVGVGVAIGLVGALLAAQPRQSERGPGTDDGPLWRLITVGLAGLAVVLGVLSIIIFMIDLSDVFEWSELVTLLIGVILFVAIPALAALGLFRGDAAWRDVTLVVGAVGLMTAFWALNADETMGDVWSLRLEGPRYLFWAAVGAAAAAPGVAALIRTSAGARRWVMLAVRLFEAGIVIAGLAVLYFAFDLVEREDARGPLITVLVLSLIALAATFVGRNALTSNAATGRPAAMGVAGALIVIGIVQAAVLGSADSIVIETTAATVIGSWFVFAVVIAVALTAPKSIRDEMGVFTIGQSPAGGPPGQPAAGYLAAARAAQAPRPEAQRPAQPAPAPGPATTEVMPETKAKPKKAKSTDRASGTSKDAPTGKGANDARASGDETRLLPANAAAQDPPAAGTGDGGYTQQMASDPSTPLHTLADIAAKAPALRPYIALNPSTYPELLGWLEQLGDPAVDEALQKRKS